jgi:acetyl esterase
VIDLTLATDPPLPARVYSPVKQGATPAPLIVFFHGGGFVIGDLDTHDVPCRVLCRETGAHVLAVDYRLAPEHPFPAAVDDAFAAYRWARAHAQRFGADPARIAVAGDSAGANLATVVTQLCAKQGEPLPILQLLFYPTVDRSVDRSSLELFAEGYFLTRADVEWYTRQYVPNRADLTDPRVSPLLSTELAGQSPALIVTAGFDPLRDEGDAYAEALRAAGNQVRLYHLTDLVHGFINMSALSEYAHKTLVEVSREAKGML